MASTSIIFDETNSLIYLGDKDGKIQKNTVAAEAVDAKSGTPVLKLNKDLYVLSGLFVMGFDPKNIDHWQYFAGVVGKAGNTKDEEVQFKFNQLLSICGIAFVSTKKHLKSGKSPVAENINAWGGVDAPPKDSDIMKFSTKPAELGRALEDLFGTLITPGVDTNLWDLNKLWRNAFYENTTEISFTRIAARDSAAKPVITELWHFRQNSLVVSYAAATFKGTACRMEKTNFCAFVASLADATLDEDAFKKKRNYNAKFAGLFPYPNLVTLQTLLSSRYLTLNRMPILDADRSGKKIVWDCNATTRKEAAKRMVNYLVAWNLWDPSVQFQGQAVNAGAGSPAPEWNKPPPLNFAF